METIAADTNEKREHDLSPLSLLDAAATGGPRSSTPQGDRRVPLRSHLLGGLFAAAVAIAGAMPALGQDAPGARQSLSDGTLTLPTSLEATPSSPIDVPNTGMGPLRYRSQSPLQSLRLGLTPTAPTSLPRGRWEHRETFDWSRMWGQSDQYLMGFDAWSSTHSFAYGVTDLVQFELGIVESGWSSGKLDGFVSSFHDLFGIAQGGRDSLPKGAFAFRMKDRTLDESDAERVSEQLVFSMHRLLTAGSDELPALSASVTLMTDLSDTSPIRGNSIDIAVSLSLSKKMGDFHAYLTIGLTWYGNDRFLDLELKPVAVSILSAIEWKLSEDWSLVLQHQWVQGAVEGFGAFSQPSHEISLGTRIRISPDSVFEVGVVENIVVFDNSPDFGLHSGVTVQF